MIRGALSLFLAIALVLGGTGAGAASGCGASAATAGVMLSASSGGCGTCGGDEDKGQPRQGCAVLACVASCVSGPATLAESRLGPGREMTLEKAAQASDEALRVRAIPPDHPPPR